MLKRVMAMVLSVCMIAALFTAVSAEETVVGGNQLTKSLTDECADLSKVWSVKNIETADENKAPLNIDLYGDKTALWLTEPGKAAEIVYRAADEKSFSSIYLEVSSCAEIKWPSIEYSTNGTAYQTLVKESDRNWDAPSTLGWTRLFNSNENNGWQKAFRITADVPEGAKYVRISASADEKRGNNDNLMFRKVTLGVRGYVSSSLTDDFTTLDKAYEITNFKSADAIRQIRKDNNGEWVVIAKETNDTTVKGTEQKIKTLEIDNSGSAATIVYRAAENKFFTSVDVNIWRENKIKSPEVSYSYDGKNWEKPIVASPAEKTYDLGDYGWTQTQDGNWKINDWIGIHNNKKDVPYARYVKVSFPSDSGTARIVNVSFTVANMISESLTENFETLDNAYSVTNFEQADALRYPKDNDKNGIVVPTTKPQTDMGEPTTIKTLIMKDHTKAAKLVYQAADGKEFTGIDLNFMRDGESVKFPEVSCSDDGKSWTTIIHATENAVDDVLGVWTKAQDGAYKETWTFRYNNNTKTVPGAKFVKVTFPASTVAYDNKRVNARIIDLTLTVDDVAYANTLSVAADGTATLTDAGGKANGAKLFIAEYNSDDILINAAAYSVATINGSFEKKLEKTADGAYFKAFLFGGESGTEPITAFATSKN